MGMIKGRSLVRPCSVAYAGWRYVLEGEIHLLVPWTPSGALRCSGAVRFRPELMGVGWVSLAAHLSIGELYGAQVRVLALLVSALLFVKAKAQSFVAMLCGQVLDGCCYAWIVGNLRNSGDDAELALAVFPLFSHALSSFSLQDDRLRSRLEQCAQV